MVLQELKTVIVELGDLHAKLCNGNAVIQALYQPKEDAWQDSSEIEWDDRQHAHSLLFVSRHLVE